MTSPTWSPDGTRIAGRGSVADSLELFTVAPNGSGATRLTNGVGFTGAYAWSPSGATIAFGRAVAGIQELFVMNADGSGLGIARVRQQSHVGHAAAGAALGNLHVYLHCPRLPPARAFLR